MRTVSNEGNLRCDEAASAFSTTEFDEKREREIELSHRFEILIVALHVGEAFALHLLRSHKVLLRFQMPAELRLAAAIAAALEAAVEVVLSRKLVGTRASRTSRINQHINQRVVRYRKFVVRAEHFPTRARAREVSFSHYETSRALARVVLAMNSARSVDVSAGFNFFISFAKVFISLFS